MNSLCTLQQLNPEQEQDLVKTLRLTLREDQSPERTDTAKVKPVGRAFALVSSRPLHGSRSLNSELIKSTDGDEEIIKVYLKAKAEDKANHEWNVSQLRNEVRHIQEARTSIKNLREEIEPNSCKSGKEERLLNKEEEFTLDNGKDLRETAQRLYAKLQEVEKKQQNERMLYEDKLSRCRQEMEQSNRARREAQHSSVQHQKEVEDLRRLLISMENEHQELQKKMKENEEELESVRAQKQQDGPLQARCEELEKTVSGLKEKIHHLDDMLKSQQRKVRQMIEQLQNSRTAMQEKDSLIQDLREKVSWLQAENLELQDKLEHFASSQSGNTYRLPRSYSRPNLQNVKRVYIPSGSGRPFPVIKLVET
ncbi:tuftelin isoform X2 [Spea bombifrons]|uniref:tuftelin isoform X2 n=1 Tax=Spea bombifrons TaxID=233779 RepID=UPI002349A5A8|nr:tuftelin isoform X2 [Spea bombifrons]